MHGRPRLQVGQSPDNAKDQGKATKLNLLLAEVLRNHHERCYTKEALKQNAQLLELNPEIYTAWNYRKLAVRHLMVSEEDEAARKLIAENELRVVERALRVSVKSYGAWHHRKWILGLGLSSLDHEFLLLQRLLKDDSRNFHGWDYRRFAVSRNNISAEKELEYATEKINENFSNYSAWHYRSTLLSLLVKKGLSKEKVLEDEYELVNQAYFTEPDDQSAWFYNTWLLGETKVASGAQLLGTWPIDGSTISADWDKQSSSVFLSSKNPFDKEYSFCSNGVPVLLSFSELIEDFKVKVSSTPELGHLNDVCWKPLSSIQGPSKIWVTEFPIQGCPEAEYAVSLEVSLRGVETCKMGIKFNLQVTTGNLKTHHGNSISYTKACNRDLLWPNKVLCDIKGVERMQASEGVDLAQVDQVHTDVDADGTMLSEEFQQKMRMSKVGGVGWEERILEQQIKNLRELLELEENSKWTKLTLSRVLLAHSANTQCQGQYRDEILDLLKGLVQNDPVHHEYYESLYSSIYIDKVLSNPKSMKELWYVAHMPADKHLETPGWLRWNGLSLSKFDSVERLMWVQRLDLSHNHLRSVQGLEEMQFLVALDISYNRIPQVASLACLRHNARLQFLNVSYNEIGSHPVDCSRYSFPSVLTNQMRLSSFDVEVGDHWEIQAVFGGMALKAIEIVGNVAANNQAFREALLVALPSLELLDGDDVQS